MLVALLGTLAGCGGDRPELVPVAGVVTHGGQPLANAQVTFYPESGIASSATTGLDGRYALHWNDGSEGAIPGRVRVQVYRPLPEAPAPEPGQPTPPRPLGPPPLEYHTQAEVTADGENQIAIDVPLRR